MGAAQPNPAPLSSGRGPSPRARVLPLVNWALRLLPFAVIVFVVVVGYTSPPEVRIGPLLAVAPALAGLFPRSPRTPLWVGLTAILVGGALAGTGENEGTGEPFVTLLAVLLVTITSWAGVVVRERQERTLQEVRSVAETVQQALLSPLPRRIGPVRVGVRYRAAAAEARIGGDLYEVILTPFGVRAVIGDVRGKGLDAVQTAAAVLGAFREAAYEEPSLTGLVGRIAASMRRRLEEDYEEFVTLLLVCFPPEGGMLVVNCGHPSPLLLHETYAESLDAPSPVPPLGIVAPELFDIPVLSVDIEPGDRVLLYTDGIIEARDSAGVFYPLAERAPDGLRGVEETLDRISADVVRHVGRPLEDDAAMLLFMYAPVGGGLHDVGAHDAGAHDAGTHDAGTDNAGPHRAGTHDGGAHRVGAHEP